MKKVWAVIENYENRSEKDFTQEFWLYSTLEKAQKGFQQRIDYVVEEYFGGEDELDEKEIDEACARIECEGIYVVIQIQEMEVK